MNLPELPPLPFLPESQDQRIKMIGWTTEYGRMCAEAERERCAQIAENTLEFVAARVYGNASAAAIRAQEKAP